MIKIIFIITNSVLLTGIIMIWIWFLRSMPQDTEARLINVQLGQIPLASLDSQNVVWLLVFTVSILTAMVSILKIV